MSVSSLANLQKLTEDINKFAGAIIDTMIVKIAAGCGTNLVMNNENNIINAIRSILQ